MYLNISNSCILYSRLWERKGIFYTIHECSAFYMIDIARLIHAYYVYTMDIYKVTKDENINLLWSWNWNFFSFFAKIVYPIEYTCKLLIFICITLDLYFVLTNSALWILTLLIKIKLRTLGRWHFVYLHKIFGLAEMNTTYWGQMFIYLINLGNLE